MGRVATGVKGIALRRQDVVVVAGVILKENDQTTEIMSISANGFGKRTRVDLYRLQSRGGKGIINFKVTSKTGPVVGAMPVRDNDGLIMLTSANKVVRIGVFEPATGDSGPGGWLRPRGRRRPDRQPHGRPGGR